MSYPETLLSSRLPIGAWAVVAVWPLLFIVNYLVARRLRALSALLRAFTVDAREAVGRAQHPSWVFVQVLYAASVFTFSLYAGGALFVFFAGGLDVSLICTVGLNVQALLLSSAMLRTGAIEGSMKISVALTYRQFVSHLVGTALMCALTGLLIGHLALLGGALFCASVALRSWRRAKALDALAGHRPG